MFRAVFFTLGIFSSVILLAEVSTVGLLWSRGYLTSQTVRDIRLTLSGQSLAEAVETKQDSAQAISETSEEQIREARIRRILELEAREDELSILKRMTTETANRLISDRQAFDQLREEFRAELERLKLETVSAATEQTRAVLLSSPPEEAVRRLSGLTVPEGVDLLRGLPEKSISRILQAFQAEPKSAPHGQQLFEALYRGDPTRSVIQNATDALTPTDTTRQPPTG